MADDYIPDVAHTDVAELISDTLEETIANFENLSDQLVEQGWIGLRIEQDWIQDYTNIWVLMGDRPMTDQEIATAKKARARKREAAKKAREEKKAKELAELERLKAKYEEA